MIKELLLLSHVFLTFAHEKPNVLLIVADDLGFYDVSYHNQGKGPRTPTIDSLAANGTKLTNYYVQPLCTPTRSALLTARLPIRDGLQHSVILAGQAKAMPINQGVDTLPEHLNKCGYASHLVGKWHLGHFRKAYWPTQRGFDSFTGFLTGAEDYYTRLQCYGNWGKQTTYKPGPCGLDFREGEQPAATNEDDIGVYSAHLFPRKIKQVIKKHDFEKQPLFMYYALQSVHYPIEVPENYTKGFEWIKDKTRRDMFGMISAMDESIERVLQDFRDKNQLDNTIIVFTSDNGGRHDVGGINWPLRGEKNTIWEGGVRSIGFATGPGIKKAATSQSLFHVSDWLPTILGLTKCKNSDDVFNVDLENPIGNIYDGIDLSHEFIGTTGDKLKNREEILINIDPLQRAKKRDTRTWIKTNFDIKSTAALIYGNWKIITGKPKVNLRYPPPELEIKSMRQLKNIPRFPAHLLKKRDISDASKTKFQKDLNEIEIDDNDELNLVPVQTVFLFNLARDPIEANEISDRFPKVVNFLLKRLEAYAKIQSPPQNSPGFNWKANPSLHGGYWDAWMD